MNVKFVQPAKSRVIKTPIKKQILFISLYVLVIKFKAISYMIQLKKKKHLAICPISEGKLPASGTIDLSRFRQGYSPD